MTTAPLDAAPAPADVRAPGASPVTRLVRLVRQTLIDSGYLLVGFPLTLAAFVTTFSLFTTGLGLTVTIIGFPILIGALYLARAFAVLERLRLPAVLRRPVPQPVYRGTGPSPSVWRRVFTPLADGQAWLDLLHATVAWILSTIGFIFVLTWWSGAIGGLTSIIWDRFVPHGAGTDPGGVVFDNQDLNVLLGLPDTAAARIGLNTVLGLVFLVTLPLVARIFALAQAYLGYGLLCGLAQVQRQLTGLEQRRDSAVSAEATALRRLERDIHDGPQQRLVRLAMDISRAREQLDANPEAARSTLGEALDQTRATLDELRALSRGIAPPILTDRGLPSALAALASRCTVPVTLVVDPELGRLEPLLESTTYFLVAEALTNVAKHSGAGQCAVGVRLGLGQDGPVLQIEVSDDGVGGAHAPAGHGIAGLHDRVRSAGGTLRVTSPAGGPTWVEAELPCG